MNEEDAKVPHVKEDWSIEIFLFSNGQQYSPPRKHYLKASELDLWEGTLNKLAQSHYGSQCPPIHLFTTDGQLVEGPLELRDGQAYVAVAESDAFVDAGYQRYLMKASKSWEKRQARRKVTEYLPDGRYCLCPEREWCCDPHTCCEHPEREDPYTQEPLLSATGHPELRQGGGHYMSSAPVKSVAASNYGSRSGIIGSTTDVVRPDEYRKSLAEFGHSPGPTLAKSHEYGANTADQVPKLSDYAGRPNETVVKLDKSIEGPVEYEANLSDHSAKFNENVKPGEFGARSNGKRPSLSKHVDSPVDYEARSRKNAGRLIENEPRLNRDRTKPGEYDTRFGENVAKRGENEARLSQNVVRPSDRETVLTGNGDRPGENRSRLGEDGVRPPNKTTSIGNGTGQGKYGAKPGENVSRLDEHEPWPRENGVKPSEPGSEVDEHETTPIANRVKPNKYGAKPGEFGTRQYGANLGEHETKPIGNGAKTTKPDENKAKPGAHETKTNINRAKPGKYGTKPGEYATQPSEYEARARINGVKPIEPKARPGEHESGPSVNTAKPGKYGTRPGDSGARTGESGAKTGDSEGKLSKSEVRSDEDIVIQSINKLISGHTESLSNKIDKNDKKNKDLTIVFEKKLDKLGEYGKTEGEQRNKQIESKDRASSLREKTGDRIVKDVVKRENVIITKVAEPRIRKTDNARRPSVQRAPANDHKRKPSELRSELEHTRRISGQRGVEIQPGTRMGESSREFECGGRVGEQKGRETNQTGRFGWQKVKENGARLSEQRNKQNDNFARLGGHETKASDLGLRTIPHCCELGNSASRAAEPTARVTAPGSKPIPRNRINSGVRTSDLGQPKPGTTCTRVSETAAILDESGIKNTEDNPGVRPVSAGGTGAAGASHTSEVQQHARKSSLFAGRPSSEKKRLPIGQNSTFLRKQMSSVPRKSEDKQPTKTDKDIPTQKIKEINNFGPIPASNDSIKSEPLSGCRPYERITPPALPLPTVSMTNQDNLTTNKASLENISDEKEINIVSTHSIKHPESLITTSTKIDSVRHVVAIQNIAEETQTDCTYTGMSVANTSTNAEVQTCTEAVGLDIQQEHIVDPDKNAKPVFINGDEINLKFNIEVRNIINSICSCAKGCQRVRSLTDTKTAEKESHISIADHILVHRASLQSLFYKKYFTNNGFHGSPNVMVLQCASCGKQNNPPPRRDPAQCSENNSKYFIMLTNSENEDMNESCNFNLPCRPCDTKQSKLKKPSNIIPGQSFSEMTLDTITTVTVSGVPVLKRDTEKCNVIHSSCQTEEPQSENVTKSKVSTEGQSPATDEIKKRSKSSLALTTQAITMPKYNCLEICPEICAEVIEQEDSHVSSEDDSQGSQETCPPEQTEECQQKCPTVPAEGGEHKGPTTPTEGSQQSCPTEQKEGCQQKCPTVLTVGCQQTCPAVQKEGCQQKYPTAPTEECLKSCSTVLIVGCQQTCPAVQKEGCQRTCPTVQTEGCQQTCPCNMLLAAACRKTCPPVKPDGCQQPCPKVPTAGCRETCPRVKTEGCQQPCPPVKSEGCQSPCLTVPTVGCGEICPPAKVEGCQQPCPPVKTEGCRETCPSLQTVGCMPASPICASHCPPLPCIQIKTQVCHGPHLSNTGTQTLWRSVILQARQRCDGRYSFYLPPLSMLNNL